MNLNAESNWKNRKGVFWPVEEIVSVVVVMVGYTVTLKFYTVSLIESPVSPTVNTTQ